MKNMSKADVVILNVGEQQYPQDYLATVIESLNNGIKKMDCNIVGCYTVMNFNDAQKTAEDLKGKRTDLFIINFVSWHITPNVMHIIKDYKDVPLLIYR